MQKEYSMQSSKELFNVKTKACLKQINEEIEMQALLQQHHGNLLMRRWVSGGLGLFLILFFMSWLVGWGFGLVAMLIQLIKAPNFLLFCWSIMWAIAGVPAIRTLFQLITGFFNK
jgi:ABC-type amino acid transport system permease subunit